MPILCTMSYWMPARYRNRKSRVQTVQPTLVSLQGLSRSRRLKNRSSAALLGCIYDNLSFPADHVENTDTAVLRGTTRMAHPTATGNGCDHWPRPCIASGSLYVRPTGRSLTFTFFLRGLRRANQDQGLLYSLRALRSLR